MVISPLASNAVELDNTTAWLQLGQTTPFSGFLVSYDRLDKCVQSALEVKSLRDKYEIDTKYLTEKLNLDKQQYDLELKKVVEQDKAVISGLSKELADKSVWYKQPFWVAAGTAASIIAIGFTFKK